MTGRVRESERERKRVVGHGLYRRVQAREGNDDIVADDSWEKTLEKAAIPPAFLLPADTMSRPGFLFPCFLPLLPSPALRGARVPTRRNYKFRASARITANNLTIASCDEHATDRCEKY